MPVHVGQMTSDLTLFDGDMPLSEEQVEKLIQLVLARFEQAQRAREQSRDAMTIRLDSTPRSQAGF